MVLALALMYVEEDVDAPFLLVKRSSTGVFQRCVEQDRGSDILLDIH